MATAWPFIPAKVGETLAFKTDIRRCYAAEARDSLRDAVQSFELRHVMQELEAARARELVRANPLGPWSVPLWFDATEVGAISAGATVLAVETNADFRAGGKAMILDDYRAYELVDVISIGAGAITVSAVAGDYVDASVVPVQQCLAPSGIGFKQTPTHVEVSAAFTSLEPADLGASGYPVLDGFEVVTDPPSAIQALDGAVAQALEVIDSGFGAMQALETEGYVRPRFKLAFADHDAATRWARRQWLHATRGRDAAFFVPTWKRDLQLTAPAGAADLTISVADVMPAAADYAGRYVQIDTGAGYLHRKITGASVAGDVATLSIAAPGVTVPASSVISFLELMRFDSDTFQIDHRRVAAGILSAFNAPTVGVPA